MYEKGESAVRFGKMLIIKPLVLCCCVANLTHMLQTSSSNQMHVLVASNNISLSYLEGRIHIITLLNPLLVLIILLNHYQFSLRLRYSGILLSFTRSFMKNTRSLVGCLENSVNNSVLYRRLLQVVLFTVRRYNVQSECVWFCNVTPDLYRKHCHATDIALTELCGSNGFYIIFSNKFGL